METLNRPSSGRTSEKNYERDRDPRHPMPSDPHCGRAPDESDFIDEETVVEDKPREVVLKLVK
jgi:hypothetical protein